jgi:hypothetical protein
MSGRGIDLEGLHAFVFQGDGVDVEDSELISSLAHLHTYPQMLTQPLPLSLSTPFPSSIWLGPFLTHHVCQVGGPVQLGVGRNKLRIIVRAATHRR